MDFDEIVSRKNTDSLKHDFAAKRGKPEGILPLWVADMDFRAPACVIDALIEKSRHGIFGYSESSDAYFEVLRRWFKEQFDWELTQRWLVKTPGVVFAISIALRALTKENDSILIQQPVYYPFAESIIQNGRKLVINELVYSENRYHIDFSDFEKKIVENEVKLFFLCNPHNPVGRVWTVEELTIMGNICLKYNVVVISDEIHADFVYPGYQHTVFANITPAFSGISITCTAPTKTFNLAGLQISNVFIANEKIRHAFKRELQKTGYDQVNIMGLVACKAAYENGHSWLDALRKYLNDNLCYLRNFLKEKLPSVKLVEPEGTYLIWLDFKALGLDTDALEELIVSKSNLWLDGGTMFGTGGDGFQRINIACPRNILEQALTQLEKAINSL